MMVVFLKIYFVAFLPYIALQCPLIGGDAVFRARGLYETVTNSFEDWEKLEDCTPVRERATENDGSAEPSDTMGGFSVRPNPAKDAVQIVAAMPVGFAGTFEMFDLRGTAVKRTAIKPGTNTVQTADLLSGIYMVKVLSPDGILFMDRLVIIE